MSDQLLIDTNVLVYAYDRSEPQKQTRAIDVLEIVGRSGQGVLSAQILAEFFVTITRKLKAPFSPADAYSHIETLRRAWTVVDISAWVVAEAARGVRDYQFSYWDAQLWAVARLHQIPVVLSEDFNPGAVIEGVRCVNPFSSDFRVDEWIG